MAINHEEIKRKAKERMALMAAKQNLSTELDAVNRREDYKAKSEELEDKPPFAKTETPASSFHSMFSEASTIYPETDTVAVGEVDKKTGIVNDGGKAGQSVLETFRKQQAIKAALGKGTILTKSAMDNITTKGETFEVPDNLRQVEGLNAELFMANLLSVEEGVKNSGENIQDYLRLIHANLTQYPELCHILNEAQIKIVVGGFLAESGTQIKIATQRGGKSMAKLTQGKSKTDLLSMLDFPA